MSIDQERDKVIEVFGVIIEALPNSAFRVKLDDGYTIVANTSGKIRQNRVRILVGDKVTVQMSTYDLAKGRITLRHKV